MRCAEPADGASTSASSAAQQARHVGPAFHTTHAAAEPIMWGQASTHHTCRSSFVSASSLASSAGRLPSRPQNGRLLRRAGRRVGRAGRASGGRRFECELLQAGELLPAQAPRSA